MGKVKKGRKKGASGINERTPEEWTAFVADNSAAQKLAHDDETRGLAPDGQPKVCGYVHEGGAPCQNRVDRWRQRCGFQGRCSHCEYLRKGGPAGVLRLAEIRRKRKEVVDKLSADAAAGLPPPPKKVLRYSRITKWPGGKGKKAATASDSDAGEDDDKDDDAKTSASRAALDNLPVDESIEIPDVWPDTNIAFAKGDSVIVRSWQKNCTLHKIHGCELEYNIPPRYQCSDCEEWMDYTKGDMIQYFVRRGQLIVVYHFKGRAHCRACKAKALREVYFPDGSEARAKGRIGSAKKFQDDPLAYLLLTAKSVLDRNRAREIENKVPKAARFEKLFLNIADAQYAIAAALLKANDPGMEKGVPGSALVSSRLLWFDKHLVARRIDSAMQAKSPITGRPMRWGQDNKNPATVSVDRVYSDLYYHDAKQLLQLIEWGWNCAFQNAPPEQRAEMLRVSFHPRREVAVAVMRTQERRTPEFGPSRRSELERTADHDESLAESYGYSRSDALVRWHDAAEGHSAMKTVYAQHAVRPTRINRDGFLGGTVDKRAWAGEGASDAEHAKAGLSFFRASGLICAVTGYKEDHSLGLSLETDRLTDDMDYSAANCVVMFSHCNFFKGTLPHTKTLAKFLSFVETVPHLKRIYDEQGLRYAVTQYVAEEMKDGPGLYPAIRTDSSASSPEASSSLELEIEPDTAPSRSPSPELDLFTSHDDLDRDLSPPSPDLPRSSSASTSSDTSSHLPPVAAFGFGASASSHGTSSSSSSSSSGGGAGLVAPSPAHLSLGTIGGSHSSVLGGGLGASSAQLDGDGDTPMSTGSSGGSVAQASSSASASASASAAGSTSRSGLGSGASAAPSFFGPGPVGCAASGSRARAPPPVVNLKSKWFPDRIKAHDEREVLPRSHFNKHGNPFDRYAHLYERDPKHGYWRTVRAPRGS
ncbi:hypothetical protein JCM9279_005679 [Rhodotorula babjevae]